jgi:biopolymer transport protein TolR
MTMGVDTAGGMSSEINVTPMIDVLLVLLIIFMVISPAVPRGEAAALPRAAHGGAQRETPVVLEMTGGGGAELRFRINQHEVARQDLSGRLTEIYANRAERTLFLKGDDRLSFTQVAEIIDLGHAAGVDHIGLMTPNVLAGR